MFWEGTQKIINSKSKTFLAFCFCFMAGAGLASLISNFQFIISLSFYLYISLFIILFFVIIFWHKPNVRFFILCFVFVIFGAWRFAITISDCTNSHELCFYNGKKVTLVGTVSSEPDVRIGEARYTVSAEKVRQGDSATEVSGRALVTTRLYPAYSYGDKVEMFCALKEPENRDEGSFRYDKYLAKEGVWSVCSYPKQIVILSEAKNLVGQSRLDPSVAVLPQDDRISITQAGMQKILWLKSKVAIQINRLWPEPESSLIAGLLYGSRSSIPQELKDNFNKTGLTHIIAISGFNITIIVVALMMVLISIGLWRQQAYWVVVVTIIVFVIFTGASASVTRAAVMGLLILTAQQIGRLSRIGNALVFTAAVMTLINPYVLVWDAGFQLSFLATLGLVYVSSFIEGLVDLVTPSPVSPLKGGEDLSPSPIKGRAGWGHSIFAIIKTPLISTLSAILATLPLILYQFGRLSLVAPLVNILILWIIPPLMLVGFLAVVLSFIFFPLGQLVAWVAHLGLQYIIILVQWFGSRSWSAIEFRVPWWGAVPMYVLIIYWVKRNEKLKKQKEKSGQYKTQSTK